MKIKVYDADGCELSIPAHYVVCDRCEGTGSHVNPSVDGHGITSDEMAELGDEFLSDYLGGVYDVACYECHGKNVVLVADESACSDTELAALGYHLNAEWEYQAECRAERMAGC